jgi:ESCRT-II complex subunit VPS36
MFNRARGGVELVSPLDFEKAARLWEKLKLPVRLRQFKSGVLVVQGSDRTDEKTIKTLLLWLGDLHSFPPDKELPWDWQEFGRGVTAQDAAERFGWSIGVAEEELEMAEDKGALCREESDEGLKFWENWINPDHSLSLRQAHNVV